MMNHSFQAVVIGVSSGGLDALTQIIPHLPEDFIPVIVVMHLKSDSENFIVPYLNEKSRVHVKEAKCHEKIEQGIVYIAPPSYHLLIEQDHTFSFSLEDPVKFSRPSIDVLFESAALVYQTGLIGVILTGANDDGVLGLKSIKEHGGVIIVQDPTTAQASVMPEAAIQLNAVDYITRLDNIASLLMELS